MPRKSRRKDLTKIDPNDVVGKPREMLKFLRLSRNTQGKTKNPLTQEEVARLMDCRDDLVRRIENGEGTNASNFRRYWIALGFRFDQLIELSDGWTISNELFLRIVNKRGLVADKCIRNCGKRLLSASAA
jgi:transcriptional regulator with XRE-family HTH domain